MPSSNRPNDYSSVPAASAEPRQVESWALTETALRMEAAQQEPLDETALLHAARLNWRLWTLFQASLLEPNCPLLPELRNGILSLSNFVDKHTAAFLADPKAEKLDVLIKINRELAGGLMTPLPAAAASSETETPVSQN